MTDAKHEAPAEGAGEDIRLAIAKIVDPEVFALIAHYTGIERFDGLSSTEREPSVFKAYPDLQASRDAALADADRIIALRARSSAPEAREEALGNLLAVIHGDGGHRALEVGVEQAAAEAEKIVARLLSSAPEAREGERHPGRQAFEAFPALAQHVERMGTTGKIGSLIEWDGFLRDLNASLTPPAPTCQRCGGEVSGWVCQECATPFTENDVGALIFDRLAAPSVWMFRIDGKWELSVIEPRALLHLAPEDVISVPITAQPTADFVAKAKHLLSLAEEAEDKTLEGDEACIWPVEALRAAYAALPFVMTITIGGDDA